MKKVLITGVNSYVGNSLAKWLEKKPGKYSIDKISLRDGSWRNEDFSIYDVVVHVAGIAHQKETEQNAYLYYEINRDLAYEIAKKAKAENVMQLIFLSSMSVYGLDKGVINENTPLNPKSNYGKSKLEAEEIINALADTTFKIAIVRPPMIYGKGCKGNYQRLANLAFRTPVFPNINNKRSMIYVENLSEFIKILIDNFGEGTFFPQNKHYVNTSEMVSAIADIHNKKIRKTRLFNVLIRILNISMVNKVFGDLVYDKLLSDFKYNYQVKDFINSIEASQSVESAENAREEV